MRTRETRTLAHSIPFRTERRRRDRVRERLYELRHPANQIKKPPRSPRSQPSTAPSTAPERSPRGANNEPKKRGNTPDAPPSLHHPLTPRGTAGHSHFTKPDSPPHSRGASPRAAVPDDSLEAVRRASQRRRDLLHQHGGSTVARFAMAALVDAAMSGDGETSIAPRTAISTLRQSARELELSLREAEDGQGGEWREQASQLARRHHEIRSNHGLPAITSRLASPRLDADGSAARTLGAAAVDVDAMPEVLVCAASLKLRLFLRSAFERLGCVVDDVARGSVAIQRMQQHAAERPYALCVLGTRLAKGLTGLTCAKSFRQWEQEQCVVRRHAIAVLSDLEEPTTAQLRRAHETSVTLLPKGVTVRHLARLIGLFRDEDEAHEEAEEEDDHDHAPQHGRRPPPAPPNAAAGATNAHHAPRAPNTPRAAPTGPPRPTPHRQG